MAVKRSVAELLTAGEKARCVRLDAQKKARSLEMELRLPKYREALFDGAISAVNKDLPTARVECASSRWNLDEVLSKLRTLETELRESVNVVSRRTTEGPSMMSKHFETTVAKGLEKIFLISSMR